MTPYDLLDMAPNHREPIIQVWHNSLTRWDEDSAYKSLCPICHNGQLLVHRLSITLEIMRYDSCISCGQRYQYMDATICGEPVIDLPSSHAPTVYDSLTRFLNSFRGKR